MTNPTRRAILTLQHMFVKRTADWYNNHKSKKRSIRQTRYQVTLFEPDAAGRYEGKE